MIQVIFNLTTSEKRAAILNEEKVVEILLDRPNTYAKAGNIYIGRVVRVLPGIQAAFIDIGLEQNGFIHATDIRNEAKEGNNRPISEQVHEGQLRIVQVKREASQTKGPLLTENITLPGEHIVYLPHGEYIAVSKKLSEQDKEKMRQFGDSLTFNEEGLIMRTSSIDVPSEQIEEDIDSMRKTWVTLSRKAQSPKGVGLLLEGNTLIQRTLNHLPPNKPIMFIFDERETYQSFNAAYPKFEKHSQLYKGKENIFSYYKIESEIMKSLKSEVWLKNGGHINIDKTEALTVIDVNTGKFTGKSDRSPVLTTNLQAAEEIAKQLRLRNISGMIVIDFIRMNDQSDQDKVERSLKESLSHDPIQTRVYGFTAMGLMETTRQKVQDSLLSTLTVTCPSWHGQQRRLSDETIYYAIERTLYELRHTDEEGIWIEVSESAFDYINDPEQDRKGRLSSLVPAKLYITNKMDEVPTGFQVRQIGQSAEIETRINRELH